MGQKFVKAVGVLENSRLLGGKEDKRSKSIHTFDLKTSLLFIPNVDNKPGCYASKPDDLLSPSSTEGIAATEYARSKFTVDDFRKYAADAVRGARDVQTTRHNLNRVQFASISRSLVDEMKQTAMIAAGTNRSGGLLSDGTSSASRSDTLHSKKTQGASTSTGAAPPHPASDGFAEDPSHPSAASYVAPHPNAEYARARFIFDGARSLTVPQADAINAILAALHRDCGITCVFVILEGLNPIFRWPPVAAKDPVGDRFEAAVVVATEWERYIGSLIGVGGGVVVASGTNHAADSSDGSSSVSSNNNNNRNGANADTAPDADLTRAAPSDGPAVPRPGTTPPRPSPIDAHSETTPSPDALVTEQLRRVVEAAAAAAAAAYRYASSAPLTAKAAAAAIAAAAAEPSIVSSVAPIGSDNPSSGGGPHDPTASAADTACGTAAAALCGPDGRLLPHAVAAAAARGVREALMRRPLRHSVAAHALFSAHAADTVCAMAYLRVVADPASGAPAADRLHASRLARLHADRVARTPRCAVNFSLPADVHPLPPRPARFCVHRPRRSFARRLFNQWGVGDAVRNDGLVFFWTLHPAELIVVPGCNLSDAFPWSVVAQCVLNHVEHLDTRSWYESLATLAQSVGSVVGGEGYDPAASAAATATEAAAATAASVGALEAGAANASALLQGQTATAHAALGPLGDGASSGGGGTLAMDGPADLGTGGSRGATAPHRSRGPANVQALGGRAAARTTAPLSPYLDESSPPNEYGFHGGRCAVPTRLPYYILAIALPILLAVLLYLSAPSCPRCSASAPLARIPSPPPTLVATIAAATAALRADPWAFAERLRHSAAAPSEVRVAIDGHLAARAAAAAETGGWGAAWRRLLGRTGAQRAVASTATSPSASGPLATPPGAPPGAHDGGAALWLRAAGVVAAPPVTTDGSAGLAPSATPPRPSASPTEAPSPPASSAAVTPKRHADAPSAPLAATPGRALARTPPLPAAERPLASSSAAVAAVAPPPAAVYGGVWAATGAASGAAVGAADGEAAATAALRRVLLAAPLAAIADAVAASPQTATIGADGCTPGALAATRTVDTIAAPAGATAVPPGWGVVPLRVALQGALAAAHGDASTRHPPRLCAACASRVPPPAHPAVAKGSNDSAACQPHRSQMARGAAAAAAAAALPTGQRPAGGDSAAAPAVVTAIVSARHGVPSHGAVAFERDGRAVVLSSTFRSDERALSDPIAAIGGTPIASTHPWSDPRAWFATATARTRSLAGLMPLSSPPQGRDPPTRASAASSGHGRGAPDGASAPAVHRWMQYLAAAPPAPPTFPSAAPISAFCSSCRAVSCSPSPLPPAPPALPPPALTWHPTAGLGAILFGKPMGGPVVEVSPRPLAPGGHHSAADGARVEHPLPSSFHSFPSSQVLPTLPHSRDIVGPSPIPRASLPPTLSIPNRTGGPLLAAVSWYPSAFARGYLTSPPRLSVGDPANPTAAPGGPLRFERSAPAPPDTLRTLWTCTTCGSESVVGLATRRAHSRGEPRSAYPAGGVAIAPEETLVVCE